MSRPHITTLVTDLDNTLYDWVAMWGSAFGALLDAVIAKSGAPRDRLLREIRAVHQAHGTSEYAFLLQELPVLSEAHEGADIHTLYADALDEYRDARSSAVELFPGVRETLDEVKRRGCQIVAYTESQRFYSGFRMKRLGLDGVLDYLFTPPDHDLPDGFERSQPDSHYELQITKHLDTPKGEVKPNPHILLSILNDVGASPSRTLYVGDSPFKDVAMANDAGVYSAHAKYGQRQDTPAYALLRQVSHWPESTVTHEKTTLAANAITPTVALQSGFAELLEHFTFGAERTAND